MTNLKITIKCRRCAGTGRLTQFNHIRNGQCLTCFGEGKVERVAPKPRITAEQRQAEYLKKMNDRLAAAFPDYGSDR